MKFGLVAAVAAAFASTAPAQAAACESRVKLENVWRFVCAKHDKNGDGRVTADEYGRGTKAFGNHDRNGDGVITAEDFPTGRFWNGFGPGMVARSDRDRDGVVTGAEWKKFQGMLDPDGNGEVTSEEFAKIAPPHVAAKYSILALSFDQDGDGKVEVADLEMLFADLDVDGNGKLDTTELRRNKFLGDRPRVSAPKVGDEAPDFTLPLMSDKKKLVQLSSFRGRKSVALVFGSYT